MTQFIGVYENSFSQEFCEKSIKYFEDMKLAGFMVNRQKVHVIKKTDADDDAVFNSDVYDLNLNHSKELTLLYTFLNAYS